MSKIQFTENGFKDYIYWQTQDQKTLKKINKIIWEIERNSGIDNYNRIIYKVKDDIIQIISCKGHYEK